MWKTLTLLAVIMPFAQCVLFALSLAFEDESNRIALAMTILWAMWIIYAAVMMRFNQ
ncbi:MAG: hypothetical protein ACRC9X_06360 [Bacteroidales bacterium]